ncbi:MAG: HTTM domain-containing protein [Acidimicrobiales bacterium]|nr:HTTM domain-containing protein [Acidimicrobiales bacterium]
MSPLSASHAVSRAGAWLDRLVDDRGSLRPIAVMRCCFGVIVVLHFRPIVSAEPTAVERFHVPWWSWVPEPSPALYSAIAWTGLVAGVAMALGLLCRAATVVAAACVAYLLVLDVGGFGHNRAYLLLLLVGLTTLPTDAALAVDRVWRPDRPVVGLIWPVYAMRVVASSIYLASGGSKWLDADWRSGHTLWARMRFYEANLPFGGWLKDLYLSRGFWYVAAPMVLAAEIAIGVGLWHRRTRLWAMALAVGFHVSIEITASVQTFSYSGIAALLLWVVHPTDRGPVLPDRLRALIPGLATPTMARPTLR